MQKMSAKVEQGSTLQQSFTSRVKSLLPRRSKSLVTPVGERVRQGKDAQTLPAVSATKTNAVLVTDIRCDSSVSARLAAEPASTSWGFRQGLQERFDIGKELGRGGNGVVRLVRDKLTGRDHACKSIPKQLSEKLASPAKRAGHRAAVLTEVETLRRLEGTLNVARLEEVYEDEHFVHLVMEYCQGGELWHRAGHSHYSERTVASFVRAVLRTLAQCHSHHILHRDVKPGNFMLLSDDPKAPLKGIDFGLAVLYEPGQLPRSDLGLEGTPWFMAPEVLRSEVVPASDVWSAGVMTHQLLTGRFPFDDRRSPSKPSISKIWQSILTDKPDFSHRSWDGISNDAKDFVAALLHKDPAQRPTARDALKHPWLRKGTVSERMRGKPLSLAVVQRIQRYGQSSVFKRTILEYIAEDLLSRLPLSSEAAPSADGPSQASVTEPHDKAMEHLYDIFEFHGSEVIQRDQIAVGLRRLGYQLSPQELEQLLDSIDLGRSGRVAKSQLAASQMDWRALQQNHAERWLELARAAFTEIDADRDGLIDVEELISCLRGKLSPTEVEAAVAHAMQEATEVCLLSGRSDVSCGQGIDFEAFLHLLRSGSADSLDLYDDRSGSSRGGGSVSGGASYARLQMLLEKSLKGAEHYMMHSLDPVPESK